MRWKRYSRLRLDDVEAAILDPESVASLLLSCFRRRVVVGFEDARAI
jgi:hypothetical protein